MAAGLGFKDFTTGEVLTAADVDGYLMQGIWVFASAAARNAAVTSPQEGNYCFLKDTNSTEYYDGSAWVAAGGSGGMTLLSTTTLSGAATTITINPTGYEYLAISIQGIDMSAGADGVVISINNVGDSQLALTRFVHTTAGSGGVNNTTFTYQNGDDMDGSANNAGWINIYNPTSTTNWKPFDCTIGWTTNAGQFAAWSGGGVFKNNAAISSIVFSRAVSATFSAGTIKVFGVK